MGKAKRFNSYDSDVEQRRKLVKSYGQARQDKSVSPFRSIPQSPTTATNINNENVVTTVGTGAITATQLASNAVTTVKILDSNVTFAKIQDIATMKVIGRTASGSGVSSEITILDSDTMSGASATTLATSESIKAYVDASGGSTSFVGFTADNDLSMGTYNIDGVDQLIFSSATSSDSPAWTATDYGIEITGGTTPTGLNYNTPTGKFHYFNIGGTPELTIAPTLITLGATLDLSNNGIQNVAHVFLNGTGTNDLLIDGHADGLDYNVPTGDFHRFYINSDERMKVHSTHVSIQNYIDIRSPTTTAPTNTAYTGIVGWFQIKVAGGDYRIPV